MSARSERSEPRSRDAKDSGMSWSAYTETARELSVVRRDQAGRDADFAETATTAEVDLERLTGFLAAQRTRLTALARLVRLPDPQLAGIVRSSETDLGTALNKAAKAANAAEGAIRDADECARQPALLPGLSPTGRNGLIYAGWCFVGWLAQCALISFTGPTDFGVAAWSLCGLPAIAFFAGYLTIAVGGQPRIGGEQYPKSVRLGGIICFVGMPLAWLFLIAVTTFIKR